MAAITENRPPQSFILSEANGQRSRENGTGGATLPAGTVVKVSTGKLVAYDGSGTVVGILLDATVLDAKVAYLARDAEVNKKLITTDEVTDETPQSAAVTGLATLGIICRD